MSDDLVTQLLPTLSRSLEVGFNVFDVVRHGTHEKQISNVFRWLLEADGTHGLGERFANIFIAEVSQNLAATEPLEPGGYWVRQEVNIAEDSAGIDIADLVLESKSAALINNEPSSATSLSVTGVTTGASLSAPTLTVTVTFVVPPLPSDTATTKLSLPLKLAFGV